MLSMKMFLKNGGIIRILVIGIAALALSVSLKPCPITICAPTQMVEKIDADFSFTDKWEYELGVYKNQYGQLSCDGFCPDRAYEMKVDGKIPEDSLEAFYQVVDTSHLYYTMQSEAEMYEWTGCNYIYIARDSNDQISAVTEITPGTHTTLNFNFKEGKAEVWAHYNSISTLKPRSFPFKSGFIKIEREAFQADTIKAQFDLEFSNTLESSKKLSWKGLIYAPIR